MGGEEREERRGQGDPAPAPAGRRRARARREWRCARDARCADADADAGGAAAGGEPGELVGEEEIRVRRHQVAELVERLHGGSAAAMAGVRSWGEVVAAAAADRDWGGEARRWGRGGEAETERGQEGRVSPSFFRRESNSRSQRGGEDKGEGNLGE